MGSLDDLYADFVRKMPLLNNGIQFTPLVGVMSLRGKRLRGSSV